MTQTRYAIYYAPQADDEALASAAEAWLGRSAWRNAPVEQVSVPGVSADEFASLTAPPRRYGFHGTLKAPFRLAEGCEESDLMDAAIAFGERFSPPVAVIGPISVRWVGSYLALMPDQQSLGLSDFAMEVVRHFEPLRAPLNGDEIERRLQAGLTPRQTHLLEKWGYPHVDDEFRFHMTLTGRAREQHRQALEDAANEHFVNFLGQSLTIDRLTLFKQADVDRPFTALQSFPFKALAEASSAAKPFTMVDD